MIAAEQLKAWGMDQYIGLVVVLLVVLISMPSTRRLGLIVAAVAFVGAVAMPPGTFT